MFIRLEKCNFSVYQEGEGISVEMSGGGVIRGPAGSNDCRIYVGNLPPDIRTKDVEDVFYKYGAIRDIDLKNRRGGPPFAFVEFEDPRCVKLNLEPLAKKLICLFQRYRLHLLNYPNFKNLLLLSLRFHSISLFVKKRVCIYLYTNVSRFTFVFCANMLISLAVLTMFPELHSIFTNACLRNESRLWNLQLSILI